MKKQDSDATRTLIITAAIDVFADVQYEQATMRQICQKSGKSPAVVYKYFQGKEQILVAVTNGKLKQFVLDMNDNLPCLSGTRDKLKLFTRSYLNLNEQNPGISWLIYVSTNVKTWYEDSTAWESVTGTADVLRRIILDGQQIGDVRKDINLHTINHLYFGGLRSCIVNWLLYGKKWRLVDEAEDFTKMIYDTVKLVPDQPGKLICPFLDETRNDLNNTIRNL
jgi:AcrR family transcriptional regulator